MVSVSGWKHPVSRDADTIARMPPVSIARSVGGPTLSPARTQCQRRSDQAQPHLPLFRNHGLVPRRFPDEAHIGGADAGHLQNLAAGILGDGGSHAAAGRGQGHRHVDAIAGILDIAKDKINIKATTNEGVGSIGKGEAIAAWAVVALEKIV